MYLIRDLPRILMPTFSFRSIFFLHSFRRKILEPSCSLPVMLDNVPILEEHRDFLADNQASNSFPTKSVLNLHSTLRTHTLSRISVF